MDEALEANGPGRGEGKTATSRVRKIIPIFAIVLAVVAAFLLFDAVDERFDAVYLQQLIRSYGYYVIGAVTVLGNIGLPVPEETTVLVSGLAAREGWLTYSSVYVVCTVSAIVGDNLGYLIGRTGGRQLILRYGKYAGVTSGRLGRFESFFQRHGNKTVFLARFVGGIRFLAGPLSGAAQMPFRKFFLFNAMGAAVWVFVVTQIGYHFGLKLLDALRRGNWVIALAIGTVAALAFWLHNKHRTDMKRLKGDES